MTTEPNTPRTGAYDAVALQGPRRGAYDAVRLTPAYVQGQHVKLLDAPEYGGWATAYVERAYLGGAYDVRVQGHHLHRVTAARLAPLDTPLTAP